ncbi:subtilisin-like protease SBT1.7 [Abrus precatorius]|uniref:Subtilisin-like protease SBT1.7 n=1 Tax=Abrus precatorius TaxID=3816 RepID=A0A8B8M4I8_ABRPR|nr:subtilisin-like protease SBT1.7 [Abrus precatorius]
MYELRRHSGIKTCQCLAQSKLVSMETLNKHLVAILCLLFLLLSDVSLATLKEDNGPYIVYVAKSEMPAVFNHHSFWYKSILQSVSNSAEMLYIYDNIHGFSTTLTSKEARLLETRTGVLKVQPEQTFVKHTTRTPHFLGLDKISDMFVDDSNAGSDVVIGLLDTGVWPESKSFDDTGLGPIPSTWKGECESGANFTAANCNKKLIGARYFLKGYEKSVGVINQQSKSPRDDDGHGTHTASTAAGSPVDGASLFGFASGTARGMASHARVAVYKVCWSEACAMSDIIAAMDKAISDNVNVISISLGGGLPAYDQDGLAIGAFVAMEKGIIVSASAGNSGPDLGSVLNQAPWMINVGAGTLDRRFPSYITLGDGKKYSGESIFSSNDLPNTPLSFIYGGELGSSECQPGSLDPKKVKGKIVLCDRGLGSRTDKGFAVKSAGGAAMVLANSEANGEDLIVDAHLLPTIVVGFQAGKALKKYLLSDPKPTATIVFQGTQVGFQPSPVVAAFSSRGPSLLVPEILKPDVIAPGVNILAAWSKLVGPTDVEEDTRRVDFNILSGTSMSCPHVSGIAALIKSARPAWSPAAIRSALMTTAYTAYSNGKKLLDGATGKPATLFELGAGHVNPAAALNPGLIYDLTVDDYLNFLCALNYTPERIETVTKRKVKCDPAKHYRVSDLNYPSFGAVFQPAAARGSAAPVVKHTRTLTNVGAASTYKASVTSEISSVKITVEPDVLSFKENEKKSFTLTITASSSKPTNRFGFGRLEWSNGKTIVGSPIALLWNTTTGND